MHGHLYITDIVFFIFLFQWYMYPKDKRRNEYGEIMEDDPVVEEPEEEAESTETIPKDTKKTDKSVSKRKANKSK